MYLPNLKEGTKFTVVFEDGKEYKAEYTGDIINVTFLIRGPEIAENIEQYKETDAKIRFFLRDENYEFTCKVIGLKRDKNDIVICKATSLFKEIVRRADTRINVNLKVKVYEYDESSRNLHMGQFVCEGMSEDISKGGIRLWSDYNLKMPTNSMFTLEIPMFRGLPYVFPARLVRSQRNTAIRAYDYDYGFVFETNMKDQQEKLILDIMQTWMGRHGLRRMRGIQKAL